MGGFPNTGGVPGPGPPPGRGAQWGAPGVGLGLGGVPGGCPGSSRSPPAHSPRGSEPPHAGSRPLVASSRPRSPPGRGLRGAPGVLPPRGLLPVPRGSGVPARGECGAGRAGSWAEPWGWYRCSGDVCGALQLPKRCLQRWGGSLLPTAASPRGAFKLNPSRPQFVSEGTRQTQPGHLAGSKGEQTSEFLLFCWCALSTTARCLGPWAAATVLGAP